LCADSGKSASPAKMTGPGPGPPRRSDLDSDPDSIPSVCDPYMTSYDCHIVVSLFVIQKEKKIKVNTEYRRQVIVDMY